MKTTISNITVRTGDDYLKYFVINRLPKELSGDEKSNEIGPVKKVYDFRSGFYAVEPVGSRRFYQYLPDKVLQNSKYSESLAFFDEDGKELVIQKSKLGEPLVYDNFNGGFAPYVILLNSNIKHDADSNDVLESGYVDMLGNLSANKTNLGKAVYSYYIGEIEAKDLINKYYTDEKIMPFILKEEKRRAIEKVLNAEGEEISKSFFDQFTSNVAELEANFTSLREENMLSEEKKRAIASEIQKL